MTKELSTTLPHTEGGRRLKRDLDDALRRKNEDGLAEIAAGLPADAFDRIANILDEPKGPPN